MLKNLHIHKLSVVCIVVSARERLLSEVKGMDKKVRERSLLRLIQSYEDEHWTAKSPDDYKVFFFFEIIHV